MSIVERGVVVRVETADLQRLLRELKAILVAIKEERKKFKKLVRDSRQGG